MFNLVTDKKSATKLVKALTGLKKPAAEELAIAYQLCGRLLSGVTVENVLAEIRQNKVGWNSPQFDMINERLTERDSYLRNPFEVEEGVVECPKCHSMKTSSYQIQHASGDESMTTHARCAICKHNFTQ